MKSKKVFVGLGALALGVGVIGISANTALAYRGDPAVHGPNYSEERHDDMTKAFANNDYETWKSLMAGKGRVTQIINKDNFAKFAEAHSLAEQGKLEEAQKIRQEIGLGTNSGAGYGSGGMGRGVHR